MQIVTPKIKTFDIKWLIVIEIAILVVVVDVDSAI